MSESAAGRGSARRAAMAIGRRALDALLPPQCLACNAATAEPHRLCATCWGAVAFLAGPSCACCGVPFDYDVGEAALCGACLLRPPAFDRARAVVRYDDASRGLILAFKHGDRTDAAAGLAAWMGRAGSDLLRDAEVVVPVPLHRWRLLRRRYNQSALLALRLAASCGKPVLPDTLRRVRATVSQGGLNARERRRNLRAAFAVRGSHAAEIRGRRVLLVDDVLTTGATAEACAGVLRQAGARAIDVLTFARVVRPASDTI